MPQPACQPAAGVLEKIGVSKAAEIVGKHPSLVRRWRRPASQNGTGGIIPDPDKAKLILYARENGIDLDWNDFRPPGLPEGKG